MKNIQITLKCKGRPLEALSEASTIAKAIKETVFLEFDSFSISVKEDSNVSDLFEIFTLKNKEAV